MACSLHGEKMSLQLTRIIDRARAGLEERH